MPSDDEIQPPASFTVVHDHKPVLYLANGTPLVRQAGFTAGGHMQTSGTYPQLTTKNKPKGGKKGGKRGC